MPITMKDVRAWLDADEVDYENAKKLGSAAIPFLMELVQGGDLGLASKATYLASMIKSEQSAAVLELQRRPGTSRCCGWPPPRASATCRRSPGGKGVGSSER